jgi:uncharacterized delta-60 repeat protein
MTSVFGIGCALVGLAVMACSSSASAQFIHALHFDADGTLDTTGFGTFGEAIISVPGALEAYSNAVDTMSNGKVLFVGSASFDIYDDGHRFMVGRLNANGTPDTTFSQDGFALVNETTPGSASAVATFGNKIVVVGTKWLANGESAITVARFLAADGSPDTTFGTNGVSEITFPGYRALATAVAIMPLSHRVVITGSRFDSDGGGARFLAARLKNDGTLDPTFSGDGKQTVDFAGYTTDYAKDMVLTIGKTEASGFVAIAGTLSDGSSSRRCGIAVLGHNGERLNGFDGDGRKVIEFPYGTDQTCEAIAMSTGHILVGGQAWESPGGSRYALTRLKNDGTLDTTFSGDGYFAIDFAGMDEEGILDLAVSGTRIVAVGRAETSLYNTIATLAQITWDGRLDTSFSADGKATFDSQAFNVNVAKSVAIESDGQLIVIGELDDPM